MTDFTKSNFTDINQMKSKQKKWNGLNKNKSISKASSVKVHRKQTIGCKGCKEKFEVFTDKSGNDNLMHWLIFKLPNCKHHGGK